MDFKTLTNYQQYQKIVNEAKGKISQIEEMVRDQIAPTSSQAILPSPSTLISTSDLTLASNVGPSTPNTSTLAAPEKTWNPFSFEEDQKIVDLIFRHDVEKSTGVNSRIWHQLKVSL